ncbi:hypothetical protein BZM26_17530 [Paraburkholderia strydomiana]|nr:hypothetical protein BZM26_17530 [Paraburkholderia strydomiana]
MTFTPTHTGEDHRTIIVQRGDRRKRQRADLPVRRISTHHLQAVGFAPDCRQVSSTRRLRPVQAGSGHIRLFGYPPDAAGTVVA